MRRKLREAWDAAREYPARVRRVCRWLPVLWGDRDWDQAYLVRVLEFKLLRMAERFESREAVHANAARIARDMRVTVEHLRRARNAEEYGPPAPAGELEFEPVPDRPQYSQLKPLAQPAARQWRAWGRRIETIEQENWNAAWEMIRRHGRHWWD